MRQLDEFFGLRQPNLDEILPGVDRSLRLRGHFLFETGNDFVEPIGQGHGAFGQSGGCAHLTHAGAELPQKLDELEHLYGRTRRQSDLGQTRHRERTTHLIGRGHPSTAFRASKRVRARMVRFVARLISGQKLPGQKLPAGSSRNAQAGLQSINPSPSIRIERGWSCASTT
jgi:hypothetical protein